MAPDPQTALASFHKAVGDGLRLKILHVLCIGSFSALELSEILDVRQNSLSHHLKTLSNAGTINVRRDGNSLYYHLSRHTNDSSTEEGFKVLINALKQWPLTEDTRQAIERIHAQRSALSESFFEKNAKHFNEFQEQVAEHDHYSSISQSLLAPAQSVNVLVEFGPGHGDFLPWLSTSAHEVYAIDKSEAMLAECAQTIKEHKITNVELLLGDSTTALKDLSDAKRPDVVVANMVLHHIAEPANFILDVAKLMKPHGVFVITDLRQHNQDWARSACGDVWLGFDMADIEGWVELAGLTIEESIFHGQRNGFEVMGLRLRKPLEI